MKNALDAIKNGKCKGLYKMLSDSSALIVVSEGNLPVSSVGVRNGETSGLPAAQGGSGIDVVVDPFNIAVSSFGSPWITEEAALIHEFSHALDRLEADYGQGRSSLDAEAIETLEQLKNEIAKKCTCP